MELQIAETKNIPVILIYKDFNDIKALPVSYSTPDNGTHSLQIGEGFVSLMALGLPNIVRITRYNDVQSCLPLIQSEVNNQKERVKGIP